MGMAIEERGERCAVVDEKGKHLQLRGSVRRQQRERKREREREREREGRVKERGKGGARE
jgi:hypothetical protein